MRVFHGFEELPRFRKPAVTVGSFDGVHLGHQALLARLVAEARTAGGESIVLTFDPHPRITLGRTDGFHQLTTLDEKLTLLEQLGIDNVIVIPFDRSFSTLTGREFIERYLKGRIGAQTLVVGYNHRFGHDRYDCHAASDCGLRIVEVDEREVEGSHVSSTVIRRLLEAGDTAEAERLLGHPIRVAPRPVSDPEPTAGTT